jgi:hypothetical protein
MEHQIQAIPGVIDFLCALNRSGIASATGSRRNCSIEVPKKLSQILWDYRWKAYAWSRNLRCKPRGVTVLPVTASKLI